MTTHTLQSDISATPAKVVAEGVAGGALTAVAAAPCPLPRQHDEDLPHALDLRILICSLATGEVCLVRKGFQNERDPKPLVAGEDLVFLVDSLRMAADALDEKFHAMRVPGGISQ